MTSGAMGAPTSLLCDWRWMIRRRADGGGSESGAARREGPAAAAQRAAQKTRQQAAETKTTTTEGTPEETEDGEGGSRGYAGVHTHKEGPADHGGLRTLGALQLWSAPQWGGQGRPGMSG